MEASPLKWPSSVVIKTELNNYAILIQVFINIRAQVSWILGLRILDPQTLRIKDPQILIKPTNQQNVQDSGSSILGFSIPDPDCKSHLYQIKQLYLKQLEIKQKYKFGSTWNLK